MTPAIPTDRSARERWILDAVVAGRHDPIRWCPVTSSAADHSVTFYVSADYLSVGGVRMPCNALTAQLVADELGAVLPTTKMVDLTWAAAEVRLTPLPWGPPYDSSMMSTDRVVEHNRRIEEQLQGRHGLLTAGHKKDVVSTTRIAVFPDRVFIHGWHDASGKPIQTLQGNPATRDPGTLHEITYADYSHGLRLVRADAEVDGAPMKVADILSSPALHHLLTYEPLPAAPRYRDHDVVPPKPLPVEGSAPAHRTIKRGSRGEDVADWQRIVGCTADGVFGANTESKTRTFQAAHGLVVDGVVGPKTWAASKAPLEPLGRPRDEHHVEPDPVPFFQARNYRRGRTAPVRVVVIHDMEAAEAKGTARNVAKWFAGAQAPMASAHWCVDLDEVVGCVREADTAFHAPGCNNDGVGVELAGYASQTREQWDDEYSRAMLARAAVLVADICKRHALPVEFVDATGLLAGKRGITTHAEVSKAYHKSSHTDPGGQWPRDAFLEMVRRG